MVVVAIITVVVLATSALGCQNALECAHSARALEARREALVCRGGHQPPEGYGGDDVYDNNSRRYPPKKKRRKRKQETPPPLWSRVASQSARLSGQALSATARASGKVAYNLVSPKHVEWNELVGLWRLDQWMNDGDRPIQMRIELTPQRTVLIHSNGDRRPRETTCHFHPSQWPLAARLEFEGPGDLLFTCSIQRKLADKSVLKLRGKIYEKRWGGRKIVVGTFIGRRRMILQLDEEEGEEEEDAALAEEEYRDQELEEGDCRGDLEMRGDEQDDHDYDVWDEEEENRK